MFTGTTRVKSSPPTFRTFYDAQMHGPRRHRVCPNVRTNTTIISNVHVPDSSSVPLHRFIGVLILILIHVRRLRIPTWQVAARWIL